MVKAISDEEYWRRVSVSNLKSMGFPEKKMGQIPPWTLLGHMKYPPYGYEANR